MLAKLTEHVGIAAWLQNLQQLWGKAAFQAVPRGAQCRTRRGVHQRYVAAGQNSWYFSAPLVCLVLYIFLAKDCKKIAT